MCYNSSCIFPFVSNISFKIYFIPAELKKESWTAYPFPKDLEERSHDVQKSNESTDALTKNYREKRPSFVRDWLNQTVIGHLAQLSKDLVRHDILVVVCQMEKSQRERYLQGLVKAAIVKGLAMRINEDNAWAFYYSGFYAELLIDKYKIQFSQKFQLKTLTKYRQKLQELQKSNKGEYFDAKKIFNRDLAILQEDENYPV